MEFGCAASVTIVWRTLHHKGLRSIFKNASRISVRNGQRLPYYNRFFYLNIFRIVFVGPISINSCLAIVDALTTLDLKRMNERVS